MLAAGSLSALGAACAALVSTLGCGGVSGRERSGEDEAVGGGGSPAAVAGASGSADAGAAGAASGEAGAPGCIAGDARCNAAFRREICEAGSWIETSFVCARTVAVSDESGSYCVTKGDGSYRCWDGEAGPTEQLPAADYVRVQRTTFGLIGLQSDGRLVAPGLVLPPDLPPAAAFRATNMWGGQGLCPRFVDGSFSILTSEVDTNGVVIGMQVRETIEPVRSGGCFFEGLAAAVMTDGSIWIEVVDAPSGNDFVDVTISLSTFCALQTSGNIVCFDPHPSCARVPSAPDCIGPELPRFPANRYHALTATYDAVCAIDEQGTLSCRRFDGADMPIDGGPYVFAEAGRDVLCAIRRDGTTECFRQNGLYGVDVSAFVPIEPVDPDW